ncbi:MAG: protein kinase [Blastocatellia bacterium]|nr:protein kinase [Blastocatellia bacterium]
MDSRRIGNYRIIDYVGGGGFGSVFKAEDVNTPGRIVAIKELHKKHTRSAVIKQRFFQEAVAMARLDHPNLPRLYTFGEDNGIYYLVMEFISGKLLSDEIAERVALSPDRAATIIAQVLKGVSYAHRNEIIHRDLKPENIMLMGDDLSTVKILDFGIARMVGGESLTMAGEGFGTPTYMSPERMSGGGGVDNRTDIYSIGIILYEMLAGKPPFESKATDPAIYWSEMRDFHSTESLPALAPMGILTELEEVIRRATAKRAEDRFSTADEMLAALGEMGDEKVSAGLAPRTARLFIGTVPTSAEVFVDNISRGLSDEGTGKLLVEGLEPGLHNVRVTKPGFSEYRISVSLEESRRTDLQVALAARATVSMPPSKDTGLSEAATVRLEGDAPVNMAAVVVEGVPAGSTVFVGTRAVALTDEDGRATINLDPGVHEIQVTAPSGATRRSKISITSEDSGSLRTVTMPLTADTVGRSLPARAGEGTSMGRRAAGAGALVILIALVASAYFVLRGPSREAATLDSASAVPVQSQPAPGADAQSQAASPSTAPSDSNTAVQPIPGEQAKAEESPSDKNPADKNPSDKVPAGEDNPAADTRPAAVPTPPEPPAEDKANACAVVTVQGPGGRTLPNMRVAIIEQPGTAAERIYGGLTGPNGSFRHCGLTVGRQIAVSVVGPRRAMMGTRRLTVSPGMNPVVIQLNMDMLPPDREDRRRPPRRRPYNNE